MLFGKYFQNNFNKKKLKKDAARYTIMGVHFCPAIFMAASSSAKNKRASPALRIAFERLSFDRKDSFVFKKSSLAGIVICNIFYVVYFILYAFLHLSKLVKDSTFSIILLAEVKHVISI